MASNQFRLQPLSAEQLHQKRLEEERAQLLRRQEDIVVAMHAVRSSLRNFHSEAIQHTVHIFESTAVKIVDRLTRAILNKNEDVQFDELRSLEVPTADIERNCEQLKLQIANDRFDGKQPCQRIGETTFVPIAYDAFTSPIVDVDLDSTTWASNEEAVGGFASELTPFLTQRVAGEAFAPIRAMVGGIGGTPFMLSVTVSTYTQGARVSYSPSYFISYMTLASPTSPVKGLILPGRYMFMISERGSNSFDKGVFDVPPHFDIDLQV